jgi:CheY-like chemotaxis protein
MPNPRLLVVDDHPDTLRLFETFLSFAGFDVIPAARASEALACATTGVDAIATDLAMPGMDGFELIRRLRHFSSARPVPIVAVTGQALDPAKMPPRAIGACRLLLKPCDLSALAGVLHGLVEGCLHDCSRCPNGTAPETRA